MKLAPGIMINGRYKLTRIIATGGMGEMWQADDSILGRKVAMKAMREEMAGNDDFLQRLRIEARNNSVLTHPNIVALHDYYEENGIGYIIMEYVEGQSLGDLLRSDPVIPLLQLLPLLSQIARALSFAHKHGIVHRDVKPANILLDKSGNAKVADFGVSKAVDQRNMTATGMVVGTAQYLSPEQAIGDNATGSSDLYALGVIAYEASQGRRPFGGRSAIDIAIAQVNNPVPPMNESTNDTFRDLVMNLLEKSATVRAVDGDAVADKFDKLLIDIRAGKEPDIKNVSSSSKASLTTLRHAKQLDSVSQNTPTGHINAGSQNLSARNRGQHKSITFSSNHISENPRNSRISATVSSRHNRKVNLYKPPHEIKKQRKRGIMSGRAILMLVTIFVLLALIVQIIYTIVSSM